MFEPTVLKNSKILTPLNTRVLMCTEMIGLKSQKIHKVSCSMKMCKEF